MTTRKTGRAARAATGLALAGVLMLAMGTEACAETQEESAQEEPGQEVSAQPASAEQEPAGDEAAQQEAPGGDEAAQQQEPAQEDPPGRQPSRDVRDTIERFKQVDPGISEFFENAAGYVVFPNIGKAGLGVGGAHGNGEVFESGKVIGKASMTQVTIGLQLGGQEYSEVIFFERDSDLEGFTAGRLELAAQVSAVALSAGAAAGADYRNGVVVFTRTKAGLMAEASVGGQKFGYQSY